MTLGGGVGVQAARVRKEVSKNVFFEKKKQKTFVRWRLWHGRCHNPQDQKFFCFFFFKKRSAFFLTSLQKYPGIKPA
jgi:hypothetical protein